MSDNLYKIRLSKESYDDLLNAQNYTFTEFGERQWQKYNGILKDAMRRILENPSIGHSRPDIPSTHLALKAGSHFFIYRVEGCYIYVVRVLHGSMDFKGQLLQ